MALLQAGAGMEAATKASDCASPSGIDAQQASNVNTQGVTLTTSVASRSDQKRVILVRHAESTWNEWRKRTSLCNGDLCCCVMDPGFVDPALSGRGIRQCARLRDRVEAKKLLQRVDLIVCSPLGRALDTCKAGFAVGEPDGAERVVVTALHRERLDSWGDTGTPTSILRERYGDAFDFACPSLQQEQWWNEAGGGRATIREGTQPKENAKWKESFEHVESRCARFRAWLLDRDEQCIVVVGHSAFFQRLLRERFKMANCEMVEAIVTRDSVRRVSPISS
jgi:broad specificity phosphatase PhoE